MSYSEFFNTFTDFDFLEPLFANGDVQYKTWCNGEFLCRTGDSLSFLYFIVRGRGKVYTNLNNGKEVMYVVYKRGMIAGDVEFLLGNKTTCNIISTDNLSGYAVPINKLSKDQLDQLFKLLAKSVGRKFIFSSRQQAVKLGYTIEERLSYYLLFEYKDEIFSMEELALNLGSTYRHLSRILKKLTNENIIKLTKKKVEILDREYLEDLSRDLTEEYLIYSEGKQGSTSSTK